jgi:hypothetical protein
VALLTAVLLALGLLPLTMAAQSRISVDGSAGVGSVRGAQSTPSHLSLSAAAAVSLHRVGDWDISGGLGVERQFEGPHGDKGYFRPDGSCCGPNWPFFSSTSALVGLGFAPPHKLSAQITGGLGSYRDNFRVGALGLSSALDIATPPLRRLALVGWGKAAMLPNYRGRSVTIRSAGLGIRVR